MRAGQDFSVKTAVSKTAGGVPHRMRILVTGGAGFVGGHLCAQLIVDGHSVICLDNLLTGRMVNIRHLLGHPQFQFVLHDVILPIPELGRIDQIYNLACAASPKKYQADPVHTFKTNVLGAINLLELAGMQDASILQSSTSEVYGDPLISPQVESYHGNVNTVGPRSCYDEGKRAAETLFHDFHESHGVRTRIARIFNTYGPGMCPTDGRVISNFVVQALSDQDITVYGDGTQTRSFCYISDLIAGLIALMAAPDSICYPINLGNPVEFTMNELARSVRSTIGSRSVIRHISLPVDDPKQRKPDITQARRVLGWTPKVSLAEGLGTTIPYFAQAAQPLMVAE
ncbi:UDP-glucuronate decarboxylase [Pseudorhodobacter antarcticus]|uniref:UDP-glucuronate decarboxylase n=2 Tax=Pseudorhodobacter antarcticus TaxID=1077947 RepID=A0A1H8MEM5_9RHOB|nr:UDP-glucuronate decarboxylase [Pseudorhodobacter antarcticus]